MAISAAKVKRPISLMTKSSNKLSIIASSFGILFILFALGLLTIAVQNAEQFNTFYVPLLVIGIAGIFLLILVILITFYNIYRQYRLGISGSRLRSKLIGLFIISSIIPLLIIYAFSVKLLNSGIDSWFDIRISEALNNSYELGQTAIDERKKRLLRESFFTASRINPDNMDKILFNMLEASKAYEVSIIGENSAILAFSHSDKSVLIPSVPDESILAQVKSGSTYHELETRPDNSKYIRIVMPLSNKLPANSNHENSSLIKAYLNALFPLPDKIDRLLNSVNETSSGFRQISYLQPQLRQSMIITLSMVLFIALVASIWLAFYLARKLSHPILQLAEGTQTIAKGEYGKTIVNTRSDELGFLVNSFNLMSSKIDASQKQVKNQHAYLETILANLSSGVLVLNNDQEIQRVNYAAQNILGFNINTYLHKPIAQIDSPHLEELIQRIKVNLTNQGSEWEDECTINNDGIQKTVRLRAQTLSDGTGHIMVFDDITDVVAGQRNAAWSEVARRLAHEIKNPLTPIQLSADRIRNKCMPAENEKRQQILDKATHTIIAQVEALRLMVEEFSEYARAPKANLKHFKLNKLLAEVVELYKGSVGISLSVDCNVTDIYADKSKLRQLLHNLIKNASEAKPKGVRITIRTYEESAMTVLRCCDNAGGIDESLMPTIFDPYVTSKDKGTGIGLAIVKKIAEEHEGTIRAKNQEDGVCFTLTIPQR